MVPVGATTRHEGYSSQCTWLVSFTTRKSMLRREPYQPSEALTIAVFASTCLVLVTLTPETRVLRESLIMAASASLPKNAW